MRFIIHIGISKTGSSAIQAFLHRNPGFLAENHAIYPFAGRSGEASHRGLAVCAPATLPGLIRAAAEEARLASAETVILSSETFFLATDPRHLARALAPFETRVVVFLRPHLDYLSSWYREGVKNSNVTSDFDNFAALAVPHIQFATRLLQWANEFPVTAVKYGQDAVGLFCAAAKLLSPGDLTPAALENMSISGNLLFLKRIVNNFLTKPRAEAPDICAEMQQLLRLDPAFQSTMPISPAIADYIRSETLQDRMAINDRFQLDLPVMLPPALPLSPDFDRLPDDRARIVRAASPTLAIVPKLVLDWAAPSASRWG